MFCFAAAMGVACAADSFLLFDGRTGKATIENAERTRQRFSPCSTFKIPNSLIALETGVVPDEHFTLEYDPKRDGPQTGAWSRDHDLRSAIRNSVVWYYREVARRIGPDRMRKYMDVFQYGNRDISGGIDQFWLGSTLQISPSEQMAFLMALHDNRLGVSARAMAVLKDILLLETTDRYRWYGKTGTCTDREQGTVAWHVGFVERDGKAAYYALNIGGGPLGELGERRTKLVREKLAGAGLIDASAPTAEAQMDARVRAEIAAFPGTVRLYAKNLDTGESYGIRETERMRTASTIKLPFMSAVFAAVEQGSAKWDERIMLRDSNKVPGSGVLFEFSEGTPVALRDLVNLMIVVSDNTATNLLIDRFTADFANSEIRKLGLDETHLLRKILGNGPPSGLSREGATEEFKKYGIGVSTPRDMVTLLEKLESGQVVSGEASKQMLSILHRQQLKEGIARYVTDEVASKSGALDRLRNDVGIVYSEGGRIAIAMNVDDMLRTDYSPENAGNQLIGRISRAIVAGLAGPVAELPAPERVIDIQADLGHVQGLAVEGDRAWITWVDQAAKTGHIGEVQLSTGKLVRSVEVQNGAAYHPGGIALEGDSIWVPVAEYKANSSARVERRNKSTLALEAEFTVQDHIGCVAGRGNQVFGGNWDAVRVYVWDRGGKLIRQMDNPSGNHIQDFKLVNDQIVAGGLRNGAGVIDWLDPRDLHLIRRIRVGKTDRGMLLTREGMAIAGDSLYLLPEDGRGRIFVYRLP